MSESASFLSPQQRARAWERLGSEQFDVVVIGGGVVGAGSALDRALSARFGFLLAIPAVLASGLFSLPDAFHPVSEGMSATGAQLVVSVVIAFGVGLAAVAWLLRFLTHHAMYWFVGYRVVLALAVMALLVTGKVLAA